MYTLRRCHVRTYPAQLTHAFPYCAAHVLVRQAQLQSGKYVRQAGLLQLAAFSAALPYIF
jgi:hypothetical protein